LIQWQLTAGQRASPIFIIFVGNTQATDIGGHPSAILEKSKSTDRSLKNDGPDPLLEVDQNTIYVCILMAKPT
jgi:hypothetical protein